MDEINYADAFVLNSYENDDPNKQFIPWDEFYQNLKPYTELIGKSEDPDYLLKNYWKSISKLLKGLQASIKFLSSVGCSTP